MTLYCKKEVNKGGKSIQKSPHLIWVLVLILLVWLDLRGLLVIRLLDTRLPSERKPTSSVAVGEEESRTKRLMTILKRKEHGVNNVQRSTK